MTSHMWSSGIEVITGTSGAFTVANWITAAGAYAVAGGYWRTALSTTAGTYTSSTNASQVTEMSSAGGTYTNYTVLGKAIDGAAHNQNTVALDAGGSHVEYKSSQGDSSPQWTSCTLSPGAQYAPVLCSTNTNTTSPVIGVYDLGGTYTVTSGTFSLTFGTDNGVSPSVFSITVS